MKTETADTPVTISRYKVYLKGGRGSREFIGLFAGMDKDAIKQMVVNLKLDELKARLERDLMFDEEVAPTNGAVQAR